MVNKVDSNLTGLRIAEESSMKTLPGSPVFYPYEPNGYNDFGGNLTLLARKPINPSRQLKKGVITDLDASGGFGTDLTQNNLTRLLQGFLFADIREKATSAPLNGTALVVSGVAASTYTLASGTFGSSVVAGDLVFASGFTNAGNNGLKQVASSTATTVVSTVALVAEASPPATAKLEKCGFQFASGDLTVSTASTYPRLTSTAKDCTTLGLIPGEWIYVGGDLAGDTFANAVNNGFMRVRAVAATYIEVDKAGTTLATDTGTGKTIRLFYGNVIKNETSTLIKRRTYHMERTLGTDANGTMSEYLTGAVPNELSLQIKQADKVTVDLSFVAADHEPRTGTQGVKSGTRPTLVTDAAFNTSSDFSRIKMHELIAGNANPNPLFAFLTDLTVTINNNVSPSKAIAVLGAFDMDVGTFAVGGEVKAYFGGNEAVQSVRNNADVTLDFAMVKNNAGIVVDLPLIGLGDGRLAVEQDKSIMLPLKTDAAEGSQGHTILFNIFPYLPTAAG